MIATSSYISAFVITCGIVAGMLLSVLLTAYMFRTGENDASRRRLRRKKRTERKGRKCKGQKDRKPANGASENGRGGTRDDVPGKRKKKATADAKKDGCISLKDRMVDKSESWTDFNCAADGEDASGHVKKSRKRQDKNYDYVKTKGGAV